MNAHSFRDVRLLQRGDSAYALVQERYVEVGIAVPGMLLLLVLVAWVPVSAIGAHEGTSGLATQVTGMMSVTPTVDVTAVVQDQLKQQDEKLQRDNSFLGIILNAVGSSIGTILVAAAALIAAWLGWRQWFTNRKDEQKRALQRFQAAVTGLGDEKEGAKVGAAILLRTFLRPGYEQFYTQTFDLASAVPTPKMLAPWRVLSYTVSKDWMKNK